VRPGGVGVTGYCMGGLDVDHRRRHLPAPVYDAGAAERHWQTLLALLGAKLKS
jgi:hypothetical protein